MLNSTEASILSIIYDEVRDEWITTIKVRNLGWNKLGKVKSYISQCLLKLVNSGHLERIYESPGRTCKCRLTQKGIQGRLSTEKISKRSKATKRGKCNKCGKKASLIYFKGEYLCRDCFLISDELRIEDFVYKQEGYTW